MDLRKKCWVGLVVEDNDGVANLYRMLFQNKFDSPVFEDIYASNIDEATTQFNNNAARLDVIFLDGNLGKIGVDKRPTLDTLPIVELILNARSEGKFKGVVIVASSNADFRNKILMTLKGTGHDIGIDKVLDLATYIMNGFLPLPPMP